MNKIVNRKYSQWSIILIVLFIISAFFYYNIWKKNRVIIDAPSYYTYLPAAFIYGDLRLNFIDKDPAFFSNKIWYYKIEGGKRLIKHPMGLSVALSPFFLAGHLTAKITGASQDGYSFCYQNAVSIGVLIYLLIGLFYIRKLLIKTYSEKVVALTLICVVLATNLLWYSTVEGLMPHAVSFSLICACLFHFSEWLNTGTKKHVLLFAAVFGLSILIRPLAITLLLYFLIDAMVSKGGFNSLMKFIKPQFGIIVLSIVITILIGSLQMMYWKYATGKWLYDVYIDEHFIFNSPQIIPFLFSFRKGLFIYSPIFIFAIIGLFRLYKIQRNVFWGLLVIMPLTIYLLSSWWAWSYGISWGLRPMIDYYPLLSIPLASGFAVTLSKKKLVSFVAVPLIALFIAFNLFQTWQYKNGLIHYDDMTKEAYFKGLFQTKPNPEWYDLLKPYDWERRIKGLHQVEYSQQYFENSFKKYNVHFRGYNLKYIAVNPNAQNALASYAKEYIPEFSDFSIYCYDDGTISICFNGKSFLTVAKQYNNVLLANADNVGINERFEIIYLKEGDNQIALRSVSTGKYVSVNTEFPNILFASADNISAKETLRLFVVEVNRPVP
ncbi:MAG: hypothetical protein K0S44_407 [Bacteroidetes bacterium]|jgi:hypothetical protein|nr:hypothetical protein [Bacteroidota bacterium]